MHAVTSASSTGDSVTQAHETDVGQTLGVQRSLQEACLRIHPTPHTSTAGNWVFRRSTLLHQTPASSDAPGMSELARRVLGEHTERRFFRAPNLRRRSRAPRWA
eukprot:CAMPEP_0113665916 /NCGR_PEP_ID=MMETSP0038_2-20120614/2567_1 /TAXON_ID=2898 /ORGANISM="Cryptomonas paramecium" /LENGTH=103 /DNA_ID=CAMNT_0000581315 /DNA_START=198 /DNA_END=505 /DNA_ORIENTATION=+ /assembly_acc=CAM_ASM_000170